mmetsp:Transcript_32971/g.75943  ORF Transcript_32971/g.75943 Transcript_32971/m.75943 type:complete len:495 (-) Transcript_32971:95-1579(-)
MVEKDLDEDAAAAELDAIIKQEKSDEKIRARVLRKDIVDSVKRLEAGDIDAVSSASEADDSFVDDTGVAYGPELARQMFLWGDRLAASPYSRWTPGAVTALDHWLAVNVLRMSEHRWEDVLLAHGDHSGRDDVDAIRAALFPETVEADEEEDVEEEELVGDDGRMDNMDNKDVIDDLLLRLSGDNLTGRYDEDPSLKNLFGDDEEEEQTEEEKQDELVASMDAKLQLLMDELEGWREKHWNSGKPYDEWTDDEKSDFDKWVFNYANALRPENDGNAKFDLESIPYQVLATQPISAEKREELWSTLSDETDSEILLQKILKKPRPVARPNETDVERKNREEYLTFLEMPREEQLYQMRALGATRALYDERISLKEKINFIQQHEDVLGGGITADYYLDYEDVDSDMPTQWDAAAGKHKVVVEFPKYGSKQSGEQYVHQVQNVMFDAYAEAKRRHDLDAEELFNRGDMELTIEQDMKKRQLEEDDAAKNISEEKRE